MPQGRRKIPFSGKKKKEQIAAKRQDRKVFLHPKRSAPESNDEIPDETVTTDIQKISYPSKTNDRGYSNRYALQFYKETDKQLRELKKQGHQPLVHKTKDELEIGTNYFDGYNIPLRPKWSYQLSKSELERNENRYFTDYIEKLEKFRIEAGQPLSYFELNLETWRQLWRVIEMCDILLMIVDIRTPTLMFPPALYDFVTHKLNKQIILVLNKIDLAPAPVVVAWKDYFEKNYPNVNIIMFTSFPGYNLRKFKTKDKGLNVRRQRGKMKMVVEGAQQIYKACIDIVKEAIDLSSWEKKIMEEANIPNDDENCTEDQENVSDEEETSEQIHEESDNNDFKYPDEYELYKNNLLTIGCVGFPNVGKSSLLNGLMGHKVVSVSRTPGHTKHFQTIFLTETVRLCDCPGLVFPSSTPRTLQVLIGSYPIAQLRVPIASIKFLAEHVDLVEILKLQHNESDHGSDQADKPIEWTAFEVCEAWALKRGFLTPKAARPDTNRAANNILRMALDGQIAMCLMPPGYHNQQDFWMRQDILIKMVKEIQALGKWENPDGQLELAACAEYNDDADDEASIHSDSSNGETSDRNKSSTTIQNTFSLLSTD